MRYLVTANGVQKLQEKVTEERFKVWTSEMKALLKQQVNKIREIESNGKV